MPSHLRSIVGSQSERIKRSSGIGTGLAEPGPNKGPVIFRGMPKGPGQGGNNTVRNVLVTFDPAECRGGPGDPSAPGFSTSSRSGTRAILPYRSTRNNSVQRPADPKLLTGGNHESDPRYWSGGKDRRHCQSCTKQQSGKGDGGLVAGPGQSVHVIDMPRELESVKDARISSKTSAVPSIALKEDKLIAPDRIT